MYLYNIQMYPYNIVIYLDIVQMYPYAIHVVI